jgi:(E)-4-hydroxy-3-methylbut-2-enyl-diphosphate synthase
LKRKITREVRIGEVTIGGSYPIAVQSMNNTDTRDIKSTLAQIEELALAGCDITRVAVVDEEAAVALKEICRKSPIPVVADIHFDYRLAILSIKNGASKIRINPGNISDKSKVKQIAEAARAQEIPIRVGVNSGSLSKTVLDRWGGVNEHSLCESALESIRLLEEYGFYNVVLSIKASDPLLAIQSYRLIATKCDYPLHLGVTEAGTPKEGIIRSAVGIGTLLAEGIGDTIRVSLTGNPVWEVEAGLSILKSLGLRKRGAEIISCPTCGRTSVDLIHIALEAEKRFAHIKEPVKIAIMGCVVNGPGEAREADIGIAGGKDEFVLFARGIIIGKVSQEGALDALEDQLNRLLDQKRKGSPS